MRRYIKVLIWSVISLLLPYIVFASVFNSQQLSTTSASNGNCLTTNGSNNIWGSCGGSSLSGGSTNTLTFWTGATTVSATSAPTVDYVTATTSSATSTLAGGLTVGGAFIANGSATFNGAVSLPPFNLPDQGVRQAFDQPYTHSDVSGTAEGYNFLLGGSYQNGMTVYGKATGSNTVNNVAVGVGSSTPFARLSIQANNGDTLTNLLAIGSSTKSGTTTLLTVDNTGNLNLTNGSIVIGNTVPLQLNGLGTGNAQMQISTSSNDFAQTIFFNRSTGTQAAACSFFENANTPLGIIGVNDTYYGGICFAGPNYNFPGFNALKANGLAVLASDGPLSIGTATTAPIYFQAGSGFDASFDMVLSSSSPSNLGIATTTPWRRLSVNGSSDLGTNALAGSFTATTTSTSTFPYFTSTEGTFTTSSTTNLIVSGLSSVQLAVNGSGTVISGGTGVNGNCVKWGANNILADQGAVCGSGGTTVGTVSTSTTPTIGQLAYWTTSGQYPDKLGSVATTSVACNNGISCSFNAVGSVTTVPGLATIGANTILGNNTSATAVPTAIATSSLGLTRTATLEIDGSRDCYPTATSTIAYFGGFSQQSLNTNTSLAGVPVGDFANGTTTVAVCQAHIPSDYLSGGTFSGTWLATGTVAKNGSFDAYSYNVANQGGNYDPVFGSTKILMASTSYTGLVQFPGAALQGTTTSPAIPITDLTADSDEFFYVIFYGTSATSTVAGDAGLSKIIVKYTALVK